MTELKLKPEVDECFDSPEGKQEFFTPASSTGRLHFIAKHYETWDDAYEAVRIKAAEHFGSGNLSIKTITVKPITGTDSWDAVVEYGFDRKSIEVITKSRGSTTGGTKHINHSISTRMNRSASMLLPAIDFGGAIGVTEKGDIEGVDVKCPNYNWTITVRYTPEAFLAMRRYLMRMTGRINSVPFAGFHRGEVLFEGIDWDFGSKQIDETNVVTYYYDVTYHFSALENQYETQVGDLVFDKFGWDYSWVYYASQTDGKTVSKYPRNVCVEQVYLEADFNDFGLPNL